MLNIYEIRYNRKYKKDSSGKRISKSDAYRYHVSNLGQ